MRELQIKDPYNIGANGTWENAGAGTLFKLISATSAINVELWQRGDRVGRAIGVTQGMGIRLRDPETGRLVPFDQAKVTSVAAQALVVAVGDGEVETDALVGTVTATLTKATTGAISKVVVGAVSGVLIAANNTRRRARARNFSATETMYVSPVTPVTANDYPVGPGSEYPHEQTGPLYAIRAAATDVDARVIEERD